MDDLVRTLFEIATDVCIRPCRACGRPLKAFEYRYCAPCDDEVREMVDEHNRVA